MSEDIRLILCFLSPEKSDIDLALDYWDRDSDGRWKLTVQEIADRRGERKHKIPELVRQVAAAYDLSSRRCVNCGSPRALNSRSDVTAWGAPDLCNGCSLARIEAQILKEQEQARAERLRLASIIREIADKEAVFDYGRISYLDAIVAYGIMQHSESAVASGVLGNPYTLALCPTDSLLKTLLARLYTHGILAFGADTPSTAIDSQSWDSESFTYYPLRVCWEFARPENGDSFAGVFRRIASVIDRRSAHPEYLDAIAALWWMLAVDDALGYLNQRLHLHRLPELTAGEKTSEAIRHALGRFSVPQVRNLLWRTAKNAAALSTRRDFTTRHALNTIPGSLIGYCDRALAGGWEIKPYCMNWHEQEPRLIPVLFDRVLETGKQGFEHMTGDTFERAIA